MRSNRNSRIGYTRRGKGSSALRGESNYNYNIDMDTSKFISEIETIRVNETKRQTVDRVKRIENEVIREILNHKDVGIRQAFSRVDKGIFKFDSSSDANTNLNTSEERITAKIQHTILKNGDMVFCKRLKEEDFVVDNLAYQLGCKRAKVPYTRIE